MTRKPKPSTQQEQIIKRVVTAIIGQRRNQIDPAVVEVAKNNAEQLERAFEPLMENAIKGNSAAEKALPPVTRKDQQFAYVPGVEAKQSPAGMILDGSKVPVGKTAAKFGEAAAMKPFAFTA
jgi:hypothetical protein